uniref:Protein kinase n=1 Tax=Pithovirus LCDPAC02 TaxID=2506601 RepID=A0A481YPG3_9VIRU|nr:MAG: hypothetical protein LCDPAC02_03400 [Pithovirus LCDPAC02]
MTTELFKFPSSILIEIKNRTKKIKNEYKFNIKDITNCKNDKNLLELIGYYIYNIFKKQQQNNLTKIKSTFTKQDIDKLFLFVFELKNNDIFNSEHPIEIFVKNFIIDESDNDNYFKVLQSLREYFIGMKISELRDKVPGFIFTYMKISENKIREIINKKYTNNLYIYKDKYKNQIIFMEKAGDISLARFLLSDPNEEDIINVYLQVILSLNAINQYYDFSHNDLHLDNIMITKLKEPKILTYNVKLNGKQVKINLKVDKYLTKIIDFGFSSIKYQYDGEEVLSYNVNKHNVSLNYPKEPFPENDIIKLTSQFRYIFKEGKISDIFKSIFEYTVLNINERKYNFFIHYDNWNGKTYDKILNYILYKCELSEYLNYSEKHEKKVECDSYLILDSYSLTNKKLHNVNLKSYIRKILNKYIKTGKIDYDTKEIYYRLPRSFKYFLYFEWTIDIELLGDLIDKIYSKYSTKDIIYKKDIKILYIFINTSIVKILLKYEKSYIKNFLAKINKYFEMSIELSKSFELYKQKQITEEEKITLLNNVKNLDDYITDYLTFIGVF